MTLDLNRESFKNLYKVFCAIPPDSAQQKSLEGLPEDEIADADFRSMRLLIGRSVSKYARLEAVLQMMRRRISSFDG